EMFRGFQQLYTVKDGEVAAQLQRIKELEETSDRMSQEITNSLILCSSERLSDRSALSVTSLLRVIAELESVCDYCYRLAKLTAKRQRKNRVLPEEFEQQLNEFSSWVLQFIEFCQQTLGTRATGRTLARGVELELHIDRSRKQLRRAAMLRMRTSENIE